MGDSDFHFVKTIYDAISRTKSVRYQPFEGKFIINSFGNSEFSSFQGKKLLEMVQRYPFFSILPQYHHRPTIYCVTKALLFTLSAKAHVRLINCVNVFPVIDYKIHDLSVTDILIYLRTHVSAIKLLIV